jgi:hypothetical protein
MRRPRENDEDSAEARRVRQMLERGNNDDAVSLLLNLPVGVRNIVASHLPIWAILRMAEVNHELREWSDTNATLWAMLYQRNFKEDIHNMTLDALYALLKNITGDANLVFEPKKMFLAYLSTDIMAQRLYKTLVEDNEDEGWESPPPPPIFKNDRTQNNLLFGIDIDSMEVDVSGTMALPDIEVPMAYFSANMNRLWFKMTQPFSWMWFTYYLYKLLQQGYYFYIEKSKRREVFVNCIVCGNAATVQDPRDSLRKYCDAEDCRAMYYTRDVERALPLRDQIERFLYTPQGLRVRTKDTRTIARAFIASSGIRVTMTTLFQVSRLVDEILGRRGPIKF